MAFRAVHAAAVGMRKMSSLKSIRSGAKAAEEALEPDPDEQELQMFEHNCRLLNTKQYKGIKRWQVRPPRPLTLSPSHTLAWPLARSSGLKRL